VRWFGRENAPRRLAPAQVSRIRESCAGASGRARYSAPGMIGSPSATLRVNAERESGRLYLQSTFRSPREFGSVAIG
jgi:hypothetical protein